MADEQKLAIIKSAFKQFKQFGFKSVTVDDVARDAGISKKTLYELFVDKDELVYDCVKYMIDCHQCQFDEAMNAKHNAIEQLIRIISIMEEMIQGMNIVAFMDLKRYYPKAFDYMEQHRQETMLTDITNNLKQGIEEGLYRENIEVKIISRFRMETAMMIFHSAMYSGTKHDMVKVNHELFAHYMYGIATVKGHKLIDKYLQTTKT
jgi:TetR/AcrR family transcriptional regulator, cholesterol catabolism regulator